MAATAIDTEITNYLPLLNKEQKEAILVVMKTFAHELPSKDYDEAFINEINSRFADYETGHVRSFTLEETENRAREAYLDKKKSNGL